MGIAQNAVWSEITLIGMSDSWIGGVLMECLIREVTSEDGNDICGLLNGDLPFGLDVKPEVLLEQISRMSENRKVAVCSDQIVGFVAAYKALILEMPNEYMRVIGLVVKTGFRRKGIGKRLFDEVERYASQNQVAYIALNTPPRAKEDHVFFEVLGFEKKSICFSKNLQLGR